MYRKVNSSKIKYRYGEKRVPAVYIDGDIGVDFAASQAAKEIDEEREMMYEFEDTEIEARTGNKFKTK